MIHSFQIFVDLALFALGFVLGILAYKKRHTIKQEAKEEFEVVKRKLSELELKLEELAKKKL